MTPAFGFSVGNLLLIAFFGVMGKITKRYRRQEERSHNTSISFMSLMPCTAPCKFLDASSPLEASTVVECSGIESQRMLSQKLLHVHRERFSDTDSHKGENE